MPKREPYTATQFANMRRLIQAATSESPIPGAQLDAECGTNAGLRSAIIKAMREQGDPVIGREWRKPFGYFWSGTAIDCREQAKACRHRASSYIADAQRFDEHAARISFQLEEDRREATRRRAGQTALDLSDRRTDPA